MFELGTPLWEIAVRSAVVYVALFVALRLMGKRELGQMTIFDLAVILLVGNAVQNAMVGSPRCSSRMATSSNPSCGRRGLDRREVEMVVREHGLESIAAVKLAVLETDGSISIVPMSSPTVRTPKHVRQMMRSRRKIRQVRRR